MTMRSQRSTTVVGASDRFDSDSDPSNLLPRSECESLRSRCRYRSLAFQCRHAAGETHHTTSAASNTNNRQPQLNRISISSILNMPSNEGSITLEEVQVPESVQLSQVASNSRLTGLRVLCYTPDESTTTALGKGKSNVKSKSNASFKWTSKRASASEASASVTTVNTQMAVLRPSSESHIRCLLIDASGTMIAEVDRAEYEKTVKSSKKSGGGTATTATSTAANSKSSRKKSAASSTNDEVDTAPIEVVVDGEVKIMEGRKIMMVSRISLASTSSSSTTLIPSKPSSFLSYPHSLGPLLNRLSTPSYYHASGVWLFRIIAGELFVLMRPSNIDTHGDEEAEDEVFEPPFMMVGEKRSVRSGMGGDQYIESALRSVREQSRILDHEFILLDDIQSAPCLVKLPKKLEDGVCPIVSKPGAKKVKQTVPSLPIPRASVRMFTGFIVQPTPLSGDADSETQPSRDHWHHASRAMIALQPEWKESLTQIMTACVEMVQYWCENAGIVRPNENGEGDEEPDRIDEGAMMAPLYDEEDKMIVRDVKPLVTTDDSENANMDSSADDNHTSSSSFVPVSPSLLLTGITSSAPMEYLNFLRSFQTALELSNEKLAMLNQQIRQQEEDAEVEAEKAGDEEEDDEEEEKEAPQTKKSSRASGRGKKKSSTTDVTVEADDDDDAVMKEANKTSDASKKKVATIKDNLDDSMEDVADSYVVVDPSSTSATATSTSGTINSVIPMSQTFTSGTITSSTPASNLPMSPVAISALTTAVKKLRTAIKSGKQKRIPVSVLTGFLGSGKTTMLNYILNESHGYKIGVIVNDFSHVNVDASLLHQNRTEKLIQLSNGCICCTLRSDLFTSVVELAVSGAIDYIMIESTGIGEPAPIVATFTFEIDSSAPQDGKSSMESYGLVSLQEIVKLDCITTVVDSLAVYQSLEKNHAQHAANDGCSSSTSTTNTPRARTRRASSRNAATTPVAPAVEAADVKGVLERQRAAEKALVTPSLQTLLTEQLEFCNLLILNKKDLVTANQMQMVREYVGLINPTAKIIETQQGKVDVKEMVGSNRFDQQQSMDSPLLTFAAAEIHAQLRADANKSKVQSESVEYGITSFVYHRRVGFNAERFEKSVLASFESNDSNIWSGILRVKGVFWIDANATAVGLWQTTTPGTKCNISHLGGWLLDLCSYDCVTSGQELLNLASRWHIAVSDRYTQLVFIGVGIDEKKISAALDECCLTREELEETLKEDDEEEDEEEEEDQSEDASTKMKSSAKKTELVESSDASQLTRLKPVIDFDPNPNAEPVCGMKA